MKEEIPNVSMAEILIQFARSKLVFFAGIFNRVLDFSLLRVFVTGSLMFVISNFSQGILTSKCVSK